MRIRVINGPNLNMLGIRESEIYGRDSLENLIKNMQLHVKKRSLESGAEIVLEALQSNCEGQLIDWVQEYNSYDALIINFGGYSHTSVSLMDAILSVGAFQKYIIEVHISNIHKREEFRKHSFSASASDAVISGCGMNGYLLAIDQILDVMLKKSEMK